MTDQPAHDTDRWPDPVPLQAVKARRHAQDPATDAAELRYLLLSSGDPAVRRAVLANRACPDDLRRHVAHHDPDPDVRAAAVPRLADLARRAETLLLDPAWQVRAEVAARPDLHLDLLVRLALADHDGLVRRTAIANPSFPADRLIDVLRLGRQVDAEAAAQNPRLPMADAPGEFAAVPHQRVRRALAQRIDAPATLLELLGVDDPDAAVRAAAVEHRAFSPHLLPSRLEDPSTPVCLAAIGHPLFPAHALPAAATHRRSGVRMQVAGRPDAPPEVIGTLATADAAPAVRLAACRHHHCPPQALATAARDPEASVRKAAVSNPACPAGAIRTACADPEPRVRRAAVAHPAVDADGAAAYLAAVARHVGDQDAGERPVIRPRPRSRDERPDAAWQQENRRENAAAWTAIEVLQRCAWPTVRALPLEAFALGDLMAVLTTRLRAAARMASPRIRVAVASHPDVPADVLTRLAADPDDVVRAAASARLLAAA